MVILSAFHLSSEWKSSQDMPLLCDYEMFASQQEYFGALVILQICVLVMLMLLCLNFLQTYKQGGLGNVLPFPLTTTSEKTGQNGVSQTANCNRRHETLWVTKNYSLSSAVFNAWTLCPLSLSESLRASSQCHTQWWLKRFQFSATSWLQKHRLLKRGKGGGDCFNRERHWPACFYKEVLPPLY